MFTMRAVLGHHTSPPWARRTKRRSNVCLARIPCLDTCLARLQCLGNDRSQVKFGAYLKLQIGAYLGRSFKIVIPIFYCHKIMDEISQTNAFVCFTIMSGVVYLPKMKKQLMRKQKLNSCLKMYT
jgi:hypothetical protein